jgi:capsular exopolysaccharide synthesis family protein
MFGTAPEQMTVNVKLAALGRSGTVEAEQFQRLRYRLEEMSATANVRVVAVTSAVSRDGKTLVAANLAASLAKSRHHRTLLIDADLRRPSLAGALGLDRTTPGLFAWLESPGADLDAYVRRVSGTTLDVLPCEPRASDAYDILRSARFRELIAKARARYQMVVIDAPPVIPVPDSSLLSSVIDGYLIVVAANATPRKLLGETLTMLEPTRVLGIVFNRDPRPFFGYAHSYQGYFTSGGRSAPARG